MYSHCVAYIVHIFPIFVQFSNSDKAVPDKAVLKPYKVYQCKCLSTISLKITLITNIAKGSPESIYVSELQKNSISIAMMTICIFCLWLYQ